MTYCVNEIFSGQSSVQNSIKYLFQGPEIIKMDDMTDQSHIELDEPSFHAETVGFSSASVSGVSDFFLTNVKCSVAEFKISGYTIGNHDQTT